MNENTQQGPDNQTLRTCAILGLFLLVAVFLCSFLVVAGAIQLPQMMVDRINQVINPTPVMSATLVLESIRDMALLETARYDFSIWASSRREVPHVLSALYGDKVEYVAVGYVTAGVDLEQIGEEAIQIGETGEITLTLPHARLLNCVLDESRSYVVNRETGVFVGPAPEIDESVRTFALEQFIAGTEEGDILTQAEDQAAEVLTALVHGLGIEHITIRFEGAAPLPEDNPCHIEGGQP